MEKNMNEIMLHPVRMRIIQELAIHQSLTTTAICDQIDDIPRTSIYRHIALLLEHEILAIQSEKKIRGSIERTLALNIGTLHKNNTASNASQNALGFLLEKYGRFHAYFSAPHPDAAKDIIFLNNTILMLNDTEFNSFLGDLRNLLITYQNRNSPGRRARDISIISAPVDTTNEQESV